MPEHNNPYLHLNAEYGKKLKSRKFVKSSSLKRLEETTTGPETGEE